MPSRPGCALVGIDVRPESPDDAEELFLPPTTRRSPITGAWVSTRTRTSAIIYWTGPSSIPSSGCSPGTEMNSRATSEQEEDASRIRQAR